MEKLFLWIKSHKLIVVSIAIALLLGPIIVVHILFKIPASPKLANDWGPGDILGSI